MTIVIFLLGTRSPTHNNPFLNHYNRQKTHGDPAYQIDPHAQSIQPLPIAPLTQKDRGIQPQPCSLRKWNGHLNTLASIRQLTEAPMVFDLVVLAIPVDGGFRLRLLVWIVCVVASLTIAMYVNRFNEILRHLSRSLCVSLFVIN